jgi:hypothetical protein
MKEEDTRYNRDTDNKPTGKIRPAIPIDKIASGEIRNVIVTEKKRCDPDLKGDGSERQALLRKIDGSAIT